MAKKALTVKKAAEIQAKQTINMGGKMEDFNSFSTSCTNNATCQARINSAIEHIRNHSAEAAEIINRYLLPGNDKQHISGKKCVELLEKLGVHACVCIFCYADKAQSWQHGARNKFQANGEYMKELHEAAELPEFTPAFINGMLVYRIEAEGDLHSVTHARNYIKGVNRPEYASVNFALWTKNPEYLWKAILAEGGKPKNIQFVLSSLKVNVPDLHNFERYNAMCMEKFGYPLFDKLFTVWTEKGAAAANAIFNCCGSECNKDRKCKNCLNCYKSSGYNTFVNELLR